MIIEYNTIAQKKADIKGLNEGTFFEFEEEIFLILSYWKSGANGYQKKLKDLVSHDCFF